MNMKKTAAVLAFAALFSAATSIHAGLIHRYSFDKETPKDSVGDADGTLVGAGAKIADGKLVITNDISASGDKTSHLSFTKPILPKDAESATLVIWFTAKDVAPYSRLIDIGDSEGGEGRAFIYFTPRNADDLARAAISASDVGGRVPLDNDRLDDGKPHMAALVFDGKAKKMHVFIDGKEPKPAEDISDALLKTVHPVHAYLGRSSFDVDPGLTGSIDEFRVYDTALSAEEVSAVQKAGADALVPAPGGATTQPAK